MPSNPGAALIVLNDPYCVPGAPVMTSVGRIIALQPDTNVLGRSSDPDITICIAGTGVGRRQARIWHEKGEWVLEEMSQLYAVRINGQHLRVTDALARVRLNDRDLIGLGDFKFWFRVCTPWHGWLTPAVVGLARCVSVDGQFDLLPILADALEEAGCDEMEVLAHCRKPRLGLRSSWVAELLHAQQVPARERESNHSLNPVDEFGVTH